MSQRKKKNVQSAKEQKPENAKPAEVPTPIEVLPQTASAEPKPQTSVKALPISLETISPDKIKMAEDLGIPVTQILKWMGSVEERFKLLEESLPQKIQDSFKKVISDIQAQQPQATSIGNTGGGGIMGYLQAAKEMGIFGGGGDSDLQKQIMAMAIESMGLGNALVKTMIIKMAPDMASVLLKPLEKKEGT